MVLLSNLILNDHCLVSKNCWTTTTTGVSTTGMLCVMSCFDPFQAQFILTFCLIILTLMVFADNPVSITPKPSTVMKDTGPRRSLNLEDYKKKRGLI